MRRLATLLASLVLVATASGAAADPPASNGQNASGAGQAQTQTPPDQVRRRRCISETVIGSNYPRRTCAMYTDAEWEAAREARREAERQTNDRLQNCDRSGTMPAC